MFNLFKRRKRGFEFVSLANATVEGKFLVMLPTRNDEGSAGYDFYSPINVVIPAGGQVTIWTNIKVYMKKDEVLNLYVRSSIGIKRHLRLANQVGIIDSSYYNNEDNEGNIGICLYNAGSEDITIEPGERIAQGVFGKYLKADNDTVLNKKRIGGIGSSGRK